MLICLLEGTGHFCKNLSRFLFFWPGIFRKKCKKSDKICSSSCGRNNTTRGFQPVRRVAGGGSYCDAHGRRKGGRGGPWPPWILKILEKRCCLIRFEWGENKFHHFWLPPRKTVPPSLEKSFQRPWRCFASHGKHTAIRQEHDQLFDL